MTGTERTRRWRKNNPKRYNEVVRRSRKAKKDFIADYKRRTGCISHSDFYPGQPVERDPDCLDFDHRDPETKSFGIARLGNRSLEAIKKEIAKCDVRCANCHRKKHALELQQQAQ